MELESVDGSLANRRAGKPVGKVDFVKPPMGLRELAAFAGRRGREEVHFPD